MTASAFMRTLTTEVSPKCNRWRSPGSILTIRRRPERCNYKSSFLLARVPSMLVNSRRSSSRRSSAATSPVSWASLSWASQARISSSTVTDPPTPPQLAIIPHVPVCHATNSEQLGGIERHRPQRFWAQYESATIQPHVISASQKTVRSRELAGGKSYVLYRECASAGRQVDTQSRERLITLYFASSTSRAVSLFPGSEGSI